MIKFEVIIKEEGLQSRVKEELFIKIYLSGLSAKSLDLEIPKVNMRLGKIKYSNKDLLLS